MKEYIVIAKDEASIDSIHAELTTNTLHNNTVDRTIVPTRPVAIANTRLGNPRITHYYLTDSEAETLACDPRVEAIHAPPNTDTKIKTVIQRVKSYNNIVGNYNRNGNSTDKYNINWGLRRTSLRAAETRIGNTYEYEADGSGVDFVLMDDGLQCDHPEFIDATGVSRVQQIDWYRETGIPGKMPLNHYLCQNYGDGEHGTHVATTVAGKTFGYAKNARVYLIRVFGNSTQYIPDADQFDLIRVWHSKKPINPQTGAKRPTIVNTSWGYSWFYSDSPSIASRRNLRKINYRNKVYDYTNNPVAPQINYGQLIARGGRHGFVVPSVNAEQQDAENAGVIFVHAAGNYSHKIDKPTGIDWNNYYTTNTFWAGLVPAGQPIHYHRGSSPFSTNCITVSAAKDTTKFLKGKTLEVVDDYSEKGPGCDVVAPGTNITAGTSNTSSYSNLEYVWSRNSRDRSYLVSKISGTSMAAPQVTGVLALYLGRNPKTTPAQAKAWIAKIGIKNQVATSIINNEWSNPNALLGGSNNYLFNPYRNQYKDPK